MQYIDYSKLINNNLFLYQNSFDIIGFRFKWAIITITVTLILWIIFAYFLLKQEHNVKNENMSSRYKEIPLEEMHKYGIEIQDFKKNIYNKFIKIHTALNNSNISILKKHLTKDLYHAYIIELEELNNKEQKIINKEFELINIKIYDIKKIYGVLHIYVYLNVKMIDYIKNTNTGICICGNKNEKTDFEYELHFIKKLDENSDYLLSNKSCINKMKNDKLAK